MPRKVRQLNADLRKAGFVELPGRGEGSHTVWEHSLLAGITIVLAGHDGVDADWYQEKQIRDAVMSSQEQ